jgi:uncharacterized RDD family membrane protein YckC
LTIEFHCPFCERLLRTPAEKAGLQATCPGCDEKIFVPHENEPFAAAAEFDQADSTGVRGEGERENRDWFDQLADLEAIPQPGSQTPAARAAEATRTCPMCGEEVDVRAARCPACGEQFGRRSVADRGARFRPVYAGFWLRFVAALIDGLILAIPVGIVVFVGVMLGVLADWAGGLELVPGEVWGILLHILIWPYYAVMESSRFQATFGKLAIGIIVTDIEGERVTFARASGRHFSKLISDTCCMLGYITAGFDDRKQAWHDSIASCLVIRRPPAENNDIRFHV